MRGHAYLVDVRIGPSTERYWAVAANLTMAVRAVKDMPGLPADARIYYKDEIKDWDAKDLGLDLNAAGTCGRLNALSARPPG